MNCKNHFGIATFLSITFCTQFSFAAFSNYNSVLIGDRAAGMGGAFTALTDDPAACSFYNPAAISQMVGHTLSASVSIFNKYDTNYGTNSDYSSASLRVNRGQFVPIPSAAGSVISFGTFAVGLSIITPDFETYSGEIANTTVNNTYLSYQDQSLWVGGNLAVNLTSTSSVGLTNYYTSHTYQRTFTDQTKFGTTNTAITNENKTYSDNSLVYQIGYINKFKSNFRFGAAYRFPSLKLNGRGYYNRSTLDTRSSNVPVEIRGEDLSAESRIPQKLSIGIAYEEPGKQTYSFDLSYYGEEEYQDLENTKTTYAGDRIIHKNTVNAALGAEYFAKPWLRFRGGIFTNYSSHPDISDAPERQQDRINMWGFSANMGVYTTDQASLTFGGYYSGGTGETTQFYNQQIRRIQKSQQIFSMLVGSAFYF